MRAASLAGLVVVMVTGCGAIESLLSPPSVVDSVDVSRYVGKWYEIAHYPTPFQAGCASSTAEYTARPDGSIGVFNTCLGSDGSTISTIEGSATVDDPTSNAKLTVRFPSVLFPAPYWIIDLGADYEYAVVGDPTRLTLFILSRTPSLDPAVLDDILNRLPAQGYDPGKLIYDTPVEVP